MDNHSEFFFTSPLAVHYPSSVTQLTPHLLVEQEGNDSEESINDKYGGDKYYESNAGDGTNAFDHHVTGLPLYMTLVACFMSLFLAALDMTIIVTIFATVGNKFNSFGKIEWLTSGFLLPMCVLTPSYGKISIVFGRKNSLMVGIFIFEIGSLVAALSNSMDMLIGGRVIQGLGGGCIQTVVSIILTESVPLNFRSYSLSLMAVAYTIASVLGPFIGGAFTSHVSWRWCFYLNLPLGGVSFIILFFFFNPPKPKGKLLKNIQKIDFLGNFLLITGLVLVLLGLTLGGTTYGWDEAGVLLPIIIGGFMLISFAVWNFQGSKNPIFFKEFFMVPQIFFGATSGFFNYCFFLGNITYLTVYFQVIFSRSPFESGVDLLPFIVSISISAIINGILIKTTRYLKPYFIISGIFGVVGSGLLLLLDRDTPTSKRIGYLIVLGVSVGFQIQTAILSCQVMAPKTLDSSLILVTTFSNFMRFLGGTLGTILATLAFSVTGTNSIRKIIEDLPYKEKNQFYGINAAQILSSPELINNLPKETKEQIMDKIMEAIHSTFLFGLGCSCAALVCCIFATNKRIPRDEEMLTREEAKIPSRKLKIEA
jgi:EmrB/QacA subfamily drug resistance transporter